MRARGWIVAIVVLGVAAVGAAVVSSAGEHASVPPTAPAAPATPACGGQAPPKTGGGTWQCTWSDEFDDTALSPVWQPIPYGLGSSCLFNDPDHVQVRDGELHLVARRLPVTHWCTTEYGLEYGGGGIQTGGNFSQQYGRFEIRAQLPAGAGFWPAFWLLPADESYGGEIDVMEVYGGRDATSDATLHVPANGDGPSRSCPITPDPWSSFHTYRLDWTAERMSFYYDDQLCADFTGLSDEGTSPPALGPAFDKPYHVLLNLAVQPWWPPDSATELPSVMRVDYIRVWR